MYGCESGLHKPPYNDWPRFNSALAKASDVFSISLLTPAKLLIFSVFKIIFTHCYDKTLIVLEK